MEEQMARLMAALKQDPAALQALMRSPDAQALMRMLTADDRGAALQQAARNASRGATSEMVEMVKGLLRSPEGAALAERISKAARK